MLEGNTAEGPTLDKHSQRTEWAEPSRRMKEPQWLELFVYLYFFSVMYKCQEFKQGICLTGSSC